MINPPSETVEQQKLVKWLRLKKIFHFAPMNENKQSFSNRTVAFQIEAKAKSMGKMKGVSDVIVMLPNKILFIELKRARKRLKSGKLSISHTKVSDEQKSFLNTINEEFYKYSIALVCYGAREAIEVVEDYMEDVS